ncbi:hypothetical protein PIB30_032322 [Stylosanthes scabra]|uniref:Uncharacterized protein n=1 Tax=Stylosanthes scabra TaxID=79078 RepID=A0ABU6RCQ6_9FABA|nr:hypothetical protein [Stylosanthes scabra]
MLPVAPRPPRPVGSPISSASSSPSGSVHREHERSPRTPLPPPAPMHVLGPMHPPPRTPMMDARCYRNLFSRHRVAPPTLPPSDNEPSDEGDGDDPKDYQTPSGTSLSSRDVSSAGASYGSERESTSFSSGPSDHFCSGSSSGGSSVGSGSATSGSASDASSDDDLVNRYFAGTRGVTLAAISQGRGNFNFDKKWRTIAANMTSSNDDDDDDDQDDIKENVQKLTDLSLSKEQLFKA